MEVPPYLIGSSIVGVMAQRLVRKVCKSCSEFKPINPSENPLASSMGVKKARFSRKNNIECPICNGTGYKGRVGIYEVMQVNDVIRELIMKQSNAEEIRDIAFKSKGRSLLSYGMDLVKNEQTTIEEVERVCLLNDSPNKSQ